MAVPRCILVWLAHLATCLQSKNQHFTFIKFLALLPKKLCLGQSICFFSVNRYAQYGDVSPKVDVYAFGVVLYELISAKEAVLKTNETVTHESKGLVALVRFSSLPLLGHC